MFVLCKDYWDLPWLDDEEDRLGALRLMSGRSTELKLTDAPFRQFDKTRTINILL